jgi:hypothetical protein
MFWDLVPLAMLTAFNDNTYLDLPSGRVHIQKFKSVLFTGDLIHRGMGNDSQDPNYRGFFMFDSRTSRQYRINSKGEATFAPVPEAEQPAYEAIFQKSMQGAISTPKSGITSKKGSSKNK